MPSTAADPKQTPAAQAEAGAQESVTRPTHGRVDEADPSSVSFAANGGREPGAQTSPASPARGQAGHALLRIGSGGTGPLLLGRRVGLSGVNTFPIVGARIHSPLLRTDVLSRERLNGWLEHAVTGRVVLIVAEAGFGKTTLLADWARQSPRLTAWYRLESDDRDWLTFARHLVASGRELDPEFAPETYSLLMSLGPGGPTRDDIVGSLAHEIAAFGADHPPGLTLIFDDYQAVDGSDEVVPTVRALLERTGPQLSIVIATRSVPRLPLSRLRARGTVFRLTGDALRFEAGEADRLFRDAYHLPVEREIINELVDRTDGWAALLSLVRANLEEQDRPNPRALVAHLDASAGDLYDYLAEEVLARLPGSIQEFLDHASVLTAVEPDTAQIVYPGSVSEIRRLIDDAEHLGLLARPDPASPHRFHPLVRDFLLSRLRESIGEGAVLDLHRRVAEVLQSSDWQASAWHYRAAGDPLAASEAIDCSLDEIYAAGQFEQTRLFLDGTAGSVDRPAALLLRSRIALGRGNLNKAMRLANRAAELAHDDKLYGLALLNLASVLGIGGIPDTAVQSVRKALATELAPTHRSLATAVIALWDAEHEGNLDEIADGLRELAARQDQAGHHRYAGVTRVNLAGILLWLGEPEDALHTASRAEVDLGEPESTEIVSAVAARATALAQLGRLDDAKAALSSIVDGGSRLHRDEASIELAKILVHLGGIEEASAAFRRVEPLLSSSTFRGISLLVFGHLAVRRGDLRTAHEVTDALLSESVRDAAGKMRAQLLRARVATLLGQESAEASVSELARIADAQHSRPGSLCARLLDVVSSGNPISGEIISLQPADRFLLSTLAEELSNNLHRLTEDAYTLVADEARKRRGRWSSALRNSIAAGGASSLIAANLLAEVGVSEDATYLRSVGAGQKQLRTAALRISRRLARRIYLRDLGPVQLEIGGRLLSRSPRRKVLGLLCYLTSRPGFAASRDEVIEALWPELGPDTAANSLHQTIYFTRRIFEPDYREGMSAGYIGFDGEVLSLNSSLVASASRRAWDLVDASHKGVEEAVDDLLVEYPAKYALDFAYDDWASTYRDHLHAAVLDALETGIRFALDERDPDRAIHLARGILAVDPSADAIELLLVRGYRMASKSAAAAEQYAHYSSVMREQLGIDPPAIDDL